MPTYLSLYEDHLTRIIEHGGSEPEIETAISEYNRPTQAGVETWVKEASLTCSYCDKPAETEGARPTDEITCREHRT